MRFYQALFFSFIFWASCSDVLIPNIESDEILLISPLENAVFTNGEITFIWNGADEIDDFLLEVATPSFSELERLVVDTFTEQRQLTLSLPNGMFEWRVSGFNSAFSTNCCEIGRFSIVDSNEVDTLNRISLILPLDSATINPLPVQFSWEQHDRYNSYRIQIATDSDFTNLLANNIISTNSFALTLVNQTTYYWRVAGFENQAEGPYTTRQFTLDYNPPSRPTLTFPQDNATLDISTNDPDFSWTSSSDAIAGRLELFNDPGATDLAFSLLMEGNSINLDSLAEIPAIGTYYWHVSVRDEVGNFSAPSLIQQVTLE